RTGQGADAPRSPLYATRARDSRSTSRRRKNPHDRSHRAEDARRNLSPSRFFRKFLLLEPKGVAERVPRYFAIGAFTFLQTCGILLVEGCNPAGRRSSRRPATRTLPFPPSPRPDIREAC